MSKKNPGEVPAGHVHIAERDHKFTQDVYTQTHHLVADEPESSGGADLGPNPYEYLLTALGTCTAMTLRMYASRKGLELEDVQVSLSHQRIHADDCGECESEQGYVDYIRRDISLSGELSDAERRRLLEIADKCPVHRTLHNEILIKTELT